MKTISEKSFYRLRRSYVAPAIKKKWRIEQKKVIKGLKTQEEVVLVGDGRCDSPGHSAKYCTYTFMAANTG